MSGSSTPRLIAPEPLKKGTSISSLRSGAHERVSTPPAYASDPKYKKYTQQVERCLNSFDSVHEWADFISFLKSLLKTLEAYQQFKQIPRKLVVAKRLSQCLNPALPTGVHQRALDVYSHIFAVLGTEGLHRDLALWSSGLFPFFEYAATSVKPTLLNLFDTYYLPLQDGLRPIMKSFILALLPGLEEETGEYFDKVLSLLDRLSGSVSPSFFFQNIWLVMLTMPSARGTSLNFLSRRLPKLKAEEDITDIVGRDVGLMIRAFSSALEDDDLLVRRGALDLLLQSLRIDGIALKRAQSEDRVILMRAASSVVLRRDLSLNRRLYSWLLGPSEESQQQMEYLRTYSLQLLSHTLREEMHHPSLDYSQARPFKIFISLLDKWEIGSPLTEVLVYDSFKAIRKALERGSESGDDISMTASTLYEAVEPHLLWKRMYAIIYSEITSQDVRCEGCDMVTYILSTFHSQDEEIEIVHLPVVFAAVAELLATCTQEQPPRISSTALRKVLALQKEILRHMSPASPLKSRPAVSRELESTSAASGPTTFACLFYGVPSALSTASRTSPALPFCTVFEDLTSLSIFAARTLTASPDQSNDTREVLVDALALLTESVSQFGSAHERSVMLAWQPATWLSFVLRCLEPKIESFVVVESVVNTVTTLHSADTLQPRLSIDKRSIISPMINALLRYLRLQWAAYHARAVNLIWSLESLSRRRHVEAVIAQRMTSQNPAEVEEACEMFGVLWRLTDDELTPGSRLKVPMMIALDTLKSSEPTLRRIGETWMRCSLKSYLRVLDPILFDLLEPTIRRSPTTIELNGKELHGFVYDVSFDQRYVIHMLEILLSVIKFGGQGFSKTARTTSIGRSPYVELLQRLQEANASSQDSSYMDVLLYLLLRFLESEPKPVLAPKMGNFNIALHGISIDILQALVARGEVDFPALQTMESAVIKKLYIGVHLGRLDLQNKLLHLLHSIISASIPGASAYHGKGKAITSQILESTESLERTPKPSADSYGIHPLFSQTLLDGISVVGNRPILQHWIDFILMTVPQFQDALQPCVVPLSNGVCRQLQSALGDMRQAYSGEHRLNDFHAITSDADFVALLTSLERLVLLSLSRISDTHQTEEEPAASERPAQESTGLLGYVSNVFSSEAPNALDETTPTRSSDYDSLHEAVSVLYATWDILADPERQLWSSVYPKAKTRCRKVLEHLFRAHPPEVLEFIVDCWRRDSMTGSTAFDIVDVLASSAQTVVRMTCESIAVRTPGMPDRSRKPAVASTLTDLVFYDFLEQYLRRLEGPLVVQVWPRFTQLAKDLLASMREFKIQAFSAFRCCTVLADKLSQTTALEDRRLRKELQDAYTKLLDICVISSKPYDQGSWIRRTTPKENLTANGRESPLPPVASETKLDEKMNASSTSLPDAVKPGYGADVVEQVNAYIASSVLPDLRRLLIDSDKVLAVCNSIAYHIINPSLKGKTRPLDIDDQVLSILQEMTRIGAAYKAWRGAVTDVLNDNRCFNSFPQAGGKWRVMVKALFDADKAALSDLLAKITTAPSANIFTNREYEMLLRSLNLRRLSYVLLSGEKNHFLTQLPSIQEKLVDTLRNVSSPIVQCEVYLCVRVLLCRLSPHNLSSFWPVILTELYGLFDRVISSLPSDGSEELVLVLAACKLLDLVLVLQTEEFQIHQWIFITDTVDAIYRPDDWFPEAMLDRLAEVTGDLPVTQSAPPPLHGAATTPTVDSRPMRRPMLRALRQIDSIRELVPFFSHASIASYESVYNSGGNVDWEAVEDGLLEDMFDGR
ncbi:hypothetical protein DAEQUDRAFT_808918 [Daedalea quercina L-15889]|uniref:Uncharacterized protein n=1 Tax=Daedalea quercina L-15889 TaxID=1314783 RepID=A0A165T5R7_9APHY|nr:hypothetical protein DAEQUDRAFT_808918 [Daedalea quercina L-15889]